jgi:hypothetical protein
LQAEAHVVGELEALHAAMHAPMHVPTVAAFEVEDGAVAGPGAREGAGAGAVCASASGAVSIAPRRASGAEKRMERRGA